MKIYPIHKWQTSDGKLFEDFDSAHRWEDQISPYEYRYARASREDKGVVAPSNAKSKTYWSVTRTRLDNVKATFEKTTGKLISVEII